METSTQASISDEQLVERARGARGGDMRAFEELIERHQSRVLANCRYLTRAPADAEDLAQEVFVKAYFGLRRFEGRSRFSTWLQRIKINHCLNYMAKKGRRSFVGVDEPGLEDREELRQEADAERARHSLDERRRIGRVLDGLSDTLRVPLVLRDADGLSYDEIAERLGLGLSAVKMRIKRGREEFRERYRQALAEERPGARAEAAVGAGGLHD